MQILKVKPAYSIAIVGTLLVTAVSIGAAVGSTKSIHKKHAHRLTSVVAVSAPLSASLPPINCWRYYGGPKNGLQPAPCPVP
jgi:hypothetical protein